MANSGNKYIEPNLMYDDKKALVVSQDTANLGCIDEDLKIIVQRVQKVKPGQGPDVNPAVMEKLSRGSAPALSKEIENLLKVANSEINFSNFDEGFAVICKAIKTLEQS